VPNETRLAAIVCADAVAFGARAAADEAAARVALEVGHQTMRLIFAAHGGEVIDTWGDGLIAEFGSIGSAVRAAAAFQREYDGREGAFRFRIGVNLGDVVHQHDDLFGHGVNVAARLQQAAEPGGVLISEAVHASIVDRHLIGLAPVGLVPGKANEPPISAWRVVLRDNVAPTGEPAASLPPEPGAAEDDRAQLARIWAGLSRRERCGAIVIATLTAINLVSNPFDPWFQYPAIAIVAWLAFKRYVGEEEPPGSHPGAGADAAEGTRHRRRLRHSGR